MPRDIDPAWSFGEAVDNNRLKIKCKFCGKVTNGGITRFKHHLGHISGNVAGCTEVPREVREQMKALVGQNKARKVEIKEKRRQDVDAARYEVFGDEYFDEEDAQMEAARRESIMSQQEEQERRAFAASKYYDAGGSSTVPQQPSKGKGIAGAMRRAFSTRERDVDVEIISTRRAVPPPVDPLAHRKEGDKQPKISSVMKGVMKAARDRLAKATAKWLIHKNIPPTAVDSPYFQTILDVAAEAGRGIQAPSVYDVGTKYLEEEYREIKAWVEQFKPMWQQNGVTIMCDGWTSGTQTQLINFLVYSVAGTVFVKSVDATEHRRTATYIYTLMDRVVESVGEEHIVQIVTDNGANFKKAGQLLMDKRTHLFWTPCAAHCIDLILEEIGRKTKVASLIKACRGITRFIYDHSWVLGLMKRYTNNHALVRPGLTRFATHFLAMESLVRFRTELIQMFASEEWLLSKWGNATSGPGFEVPNLMRDNKFWKKVRKVLKVFEPLVKVLRLVDGDDKPTMGFIYEAMDRAKQAIMENVKYHDKYIKIIDARWNDQLHHPLHAAGN